MNPVWNQSISFQIGCRDKILSFALYDDGFTKKSTIGRCQLNLFGAENILKPSKALIKRILDLQKKNGSRIGYLRIETKFVPNRC